MRPLTRRLQALLLLLTLVGGSFGLPIYDAVVYHSALEHTQPRANGVAGASAASAHSVSCAIDLATRCGTGIAPLADLAFAVIAPVRTVVVRPAQTVPLQTWLHTSQSRAPPPSFS